MNSYYSNLIEGHKTLPRDIEKALADDFSSDPEKRANQHLVRAHIEVEKLMLNRLRHEPDLAIHSSEFFCWLHHEFYQRLPAEMQSTHTVSGKKYNFTRALFGRLRWTLELISRRTIKAIAAACLQHILSRSFLLERFRSSFTTSTIR